MKLENQVCSLELAKKLKELGVKQESLFYWVRHWNEGKWVDKLFYLKDEDDKVNSFTSAFTVAELGEMLTKQQIKNSLDGSNDTETNARAKMLIYLVENKLIEGGEVK
jgi:hypothetical protein